MSTFDMTKIKASFNSRTPVKLVGIFQIILGVLFILIWLGRIVPSFAGDYFALDPGAVVPLSIIAGIGLLKKKSFAYFWAPLVLVKGITLFTVMVAMAFFRLPTVFP